MKQIFKNLKEKIIKIFKKQEEKAYNFLKDNAPRIIRRGWIYIGMFIVLFIFALGVLAFILGVLEIILKHHSDFLLVVISVLKNLLLAFVLIMLSRGIYRVIKEKAEEEEEEKGFREMDLSEIEKNFIGIIILTMLVVVLGLILNHKNVNEILFLCIAISALIISLSFYIKFKGEGKEG